MSQISRKERKLEEACVIEGDLRRRVTFLGRPTWRRQYFALNRQALFVYTKRDGKEIERFPLTKNSTVEEGMAAGIFMFIDTDKKAPRSLMLKASSQEEAERWLSALKIEITAASFTNFRRAVASARLTSTAGASLQSAASARHRSCPAGTFVLPPPPPPQEEDAPPPPPPEEDAPPPPPPTFVAASVPPPPPPSGAGVVEAIPPPPPTLPSPPLAPHSAKSVDSSYPDPPAFVFKPKKVPFSKPPPPPPPPVAAN